MAKAPRKPSERFTRLAASVREERDRLARVVQETAGALKRLSSSRVPSTLELRGLGDVLHDFYTGAERIFAKIAPELNGGVPAGLSWHHELLGNMTLELPGIRPAVIRRETARALEEFLRFRHLFRNVYGFELEWPRLRALARRVPKAWRLLRADVKRFLSFLDATARAEE
jgi:hypothetical protein